MGKGCCHPSGGKGVCLLTPGKVLVICTVIQTVVAILALLVAVL
ncbi:hypothetical protein [Azospirillum argentinense]